MTRQSGPNVQRVLPAVRPEQQAYLKIEVRAASFALMVC